MRIAADKKAAVKKMPTNEDAYSFRKRFINLKLQLQKDFITQEEYEKAGNLLHDIQDFYESLPERHKIGEEEIRNKFETSGFDEFKGHFLRMTGEIEERLSADGDKVKSSGLGVRDFVAPLYTRFVNNEINVRSKAITLDEGLQNIKGICKNAQFITQQVKGYTK
jgi:hypothetical protein